MTSRNRPPVAHPVSDAEWLRRYDAHCREQVLLDASVRRRPWQDHLRGGDRLATLKHDEDEVHARLWWYRDWLERWYGNRTLYRVLPDGTTEEVPEELPGWTA